MLNRLFIKSILLIIIYSYCFNANAQISAIFKGVKMKDPLQTVKDKVMAHCSSVQVFAPNRPSFPLAKQKEAHLICKNYQMSKGKVAFQEVAFVFADDQLCLIEARGSLTKRIAFNEFYKGYKFFIYADKMVVNEAKKTVWFITDEGAHTNLFAWTNPYFIAKNTKEYNPSARVPAMFTFGKSPEALKPIFEKNTSFLNTQTFGKDRVQINCFGVEYAGFPRKVEAVFNKGKLYLLWILTAKQEEDRVRQALIKTYGKAIYQDQNWEVFNDWQVMLRKDKPEVLVISKDKVPEYKKRLLEAKKK